VRAVIESMNGARFVHDTLEELGWEVLVADATTHKPPRRPLDTAPTFIQTISERQRRRLPVVALRLVGPAGRRARPPSSSGDPAIAGTTEPDEQR
jgi:hypothetical protein